MNLEYYKGMTERDLLINVATKVDYIEETLKVTVVDVQTCKQCIASIKATCKSREDCARKDTRKFLAIGSGLGAVIYGIIEAIRHRLW